MKILIRKIGRTLGLWGLASHEKISRKSVSLKSTHGSRGTVLLAYILDPFLTRGGDPSVKHTNYYESTLMARSYLELGFDVDVIHYTNRNFVPRKDYALYVNARDNFAHIADKLNEDCIKIVHLDTAHFLFNNYEAYSRSLALQRRRGKTVISRKLFKENYAIERADYATMLGNSFTMGTYAYAKKRIFPLPVPSPVMFPFDESKDYSASRKHFLWLGSSGLIHKGLDLVLEAFAQMPDFRLTVCGPIDQEKEFQSAYFKELYETPNIHTAGWIDINSDKFKAIANSCVGLIYPSCAEGQAGAVINCLQAGMLPIISKESGVDVGDYGFILQENSISEIRNIATRVSHLPEDTIKQMSYNAWKYARDNHSGEKYLQEYKKIIGNILATRNPQAESGVNNETARV